VGDWLSSARLRLDYYYMWPRRQRAFGGAARVGVAPASLAQILEELLAACERYMPRLKFEPLKMALDDRQRNWLAS
jgi:hypothetical protein